MDDNMTLYIKSLSDLMQELVGKTAIGQELGPADGRLYMQLSDTLTAHAEMMETVFLENLRQLRNNLRNDTETNLGPASDQPPDPGA